MPSPLPPTILYRGVKYVLHKAATISDEERNLLDELVRMEAESEERPDPRKFVADENVISQYEAFRAALEKAVAEVPNLGSILRDGVPSSELVNEDGIYAVLMTLRGEGVGIWDGRWDHLFKNPKKAISALESYFKQTLGKYADDTGGGSLNQALMDAVYKQSGAQED